MPTDVVRWSSVAGVEPASVAFSGDLVVAASVCGLDRVSGEAPGVIQGEFDLAFENLLAILGEAGVPLTEVGLVNVWIPSREMRPYIDSAWLKIFPGPVRPARKTNESPLQGGRHVMLQAFGRRGAEVTPLEIPGMTHRSPLPPAARLGSWLFSSVIGAENPASGKAPNEPAAQIEQAFENVEAVMRAAGGDARGVNHLWVFLADMAHNKIMLEAYLKRFDGEGDRPARKTVRYKLPPGAHIQVQIVGDTRPRQANFEVPGVTHHDPIPLASRAGGLILSSGVHGIDPETSRVVTGDIVRETATGLSNVESLMRACGASLGNIAGLTVLVRDYAYASIVRRHVEALFGEGAPALQFVNYPLPGDLNVQFHVAAY